MALSLFSSLGDLSVYESEKEFCLRVFLHIPLFVCHFNFSALENQSDSL